MSRLGTPAVEGLGATDLTDLRADRRLKFLHKLEHALLRRMQAKGIPGTGLIRRAVRLVVPLPTPTGPTLITTSHGFHILVDPDDPNHESRIFALGTLEAGTLHVMRRLLRPGDCFIDVGANIGFLSLAASHMVGSGGIVIAVEPLPRNHDRLVFNVDLNQIQNISTFRVALGSRSAEAVIYENPTIGWGGPTLHHAEESAAGHDVLIRRLDEFAGALQLQQIRLIKIDVEGWELEVLRGSGKTLTDKGAPALIVECSALHPQYGGKTADIFEYITRRCGYQVFAFTRGAWKESRLSLLPSPSRLPTHDNIVCLKSDHIEGLPKRMFA